MKAITFKLKLVQHDDVSVDHQICDSEHYLVKHWREDGQPIYLCAPGVWDFFDIDPSLPVEIVVQSNKPRFHECYHAQGGPQLNQFCWVIRNAKGGSTSPWSCEVDELFSRLFPGGEVYISAYQGG